MYQTSFLFLALGSFPILPHKLRLIIVKAEALYDFEAGKDDELSMKAGDILYVDSPQPYLRDWWTGTLGPKTGIFPAQYVTILDRFQGWLLDPSFFLLLPPLFFLLCPISFVAPG